MATDWSWFVTVNINNIAVDESSIKHDRDTTVYKLQTTPYVYRMKNSSAHAHSFKQCKISLCDTQGNGRSSTVSQVRIQTSDGSLRTWAFCPMVTSNRRVYCL